MLEGLEVTEIEYSKIEYENRYDSEYFQNKYIKADKYIRQRDFFEIGSEYKVTDGEHGSVTFKDSGIKYLTAENVKKGFVDISSIRFVDEEVNKRNLRAEVHVGDILISIKGTLGEIAIAEPWLLPANMNRDVAIIKPLDTLVPSEYISAFLMSKYGAIQSQRGGSGGVQQMITLQRLRKFVVPKFSNTFYDSVKNTYNQFLKKRVEAQQTYSQAEEILLAEIGLKDFLPSTEPVNIKSFSDSFAATGRIDAEYYQPKHDDYIKLVRSYKKGSEPISEACIQNGKNFNPEGKTEYRYIELSNIGKTGDINGCTVNIGEELPSRARRLVHTNDVVISSIEGSLDSCALVTKEYDGALCSTGFYVLRSDKINSETLLVLFKSELMQNLLKQNCSGTILTAINKDEFLNIPVPLIAKPQQQQIAKLIEQSFTLKKQSETLLEVAKKAVEFAIEQDEATALQYIKEHE